MNKKQKVFGSRSIVCLIFILLLLLSWQPFGYSQEISRPVTYSSEFKPLGDGINWKASVPPDFESVHLYFRFQVDPGSVETEINGNITFDQNNQTLSAERRTVTVDGNSYVGKIAYSGGIILSGEIVFDFVIPIPLFPDISIDHSVPIPGFPQIDKSWDEEKLFNSLLLADGESVEVEGGVRKLVSVEITAVEIAELLAVVLSQGTLPQRIADKAGKIIKKYIGDGGISLNGGLKNTFTLSGKGIYIDGQLITEENQNVSIPSLDTSLNSYSLHSSYEERFSIRLDFVLSSDVFFNFAPFGIELWSYEKEILEVPIPIVPDTEINTLDFVTTPDTITFPTKTTEQPTVNRTPVASGPISPQSVRIGDAYTKIDISNNFRDPDGDTLTYLATSSNQNVLTLQRVGSEITLLPWTTGTATVTVTATDPNGLSTTLTFSVTVQPSTPTSVNRAPESVGTINTQALYVGGYSSTIDVSSYFNDPDGDTLTYSVTSNDTRIVTAETLNNARIRINPQANGSTTVTVTASDGNLSTTQSFSVTVSTLLIIGNRAPIAQGTISSKTMTVGDASKTIDVSGYFRDPDGDSLTYSVSSDDRDVVSVQRTGSSSIRLTPEDDGNATVTVTASDGSLSITQTFSVTVNSSSVNISDVPDVVVENISADFTNNYPGERYTVSVTVRNAGGRRAYSVRLRYYYSDDATYSSDDEEYEKLYDSLGGMDSGETGRENVHLDAPDEQGSYYIIARADRVRNERNTRNNYAAIKITVLPPRAPDLIVTLTATHRSNISTLSSHNYLIDPNDYFRLMALVQNIGNADASSGTTVRYYVSSDATFSSDDKEIGSDTIKERQIEEGRTQDEYYGLRAPQKPGQYYYFACVDSVDNERKTDNNCSNVAILNVRGPDLVIDSVSVDYFFDSHTTVEPNGAFKLHATVQNVGTDEASSTTLRYYISSDETLSDDDTEIDTDRVHSLDPNETEDEQSNTIFFSYVSGFFYCFVCIDEIADEIHTDNNCSDPIKITVRNVAPQPQGTITAQTLEVGSPTSLDVSDYFIDRNSDTLIYTASSSNTSVVTASNSGSQITITPLTVGSAIITVTASDGTLSTTQTISISVNAAVSEEDWMPDAILRKLVRESLGLTSEEKFTKQVIIDLTELSDHRFEEHGFDSSQITKITDLTGLEYATGITFLNLPHNSISDISALSRLTLLTDLILNNNSISNITPLSGLTSLIYLRLDNNSISNVSAVSGLTSLTELYLDNNSISNVSALSGLTSLTLLGLENNSLSDISALSGLTSLTHLYLDNNSLSDISALSGLTSLTDLSLNDNSLSDISALSGLTSLTHLYLDNNSIIDISPFSGLTSLIGLTLINNSISDISVVSGLTSLTGLDLTNNSISDVTPLEDSVELIGLFLEGNPITDFGPLRRLKAKKSNLKIDIDITTDPSVVNRSPTAVGTISARTLTVGDSPVQVDVSANFQDADNDTLIYTISSNNTSAATASVSGSRVSITPVSAGNATITVTASDGELTATQTVFVTVTAAPVANHAPVTVGAILARTLTVGDSPDQIDVSSNFNDPDNDDLRYTVNSNNSSVVTASASGSQVTITPVAAGSATITVTASDGKLTATQTIAISVTDTSSTSIMPDPNLATAVRETLGLGTNDDITQTNIQRLTSLEAENRRITNLTGLEYATSLETLALSNNQISNVSSLTTLTRLTTLSIYNNQISDLSPLAGLTNLKTLFLNGNNISDVSALTTLTNLDSLSLHGNNISDVSALATLTKLTSLALYNNQISDVSSLTSLTNLEILQLHGNQITALPTGLFSGFSNLRQLHLSPNPGGPFTLTLELERTDTTDLTSSGPATVKVKVAEGAPFAMSVNLSVFGGTLSATTATIAKGSTESGAITVTQTGTGVTTVSLGTPPSLPSANYKGFQTAVGDSLILYSGVGSNNSPFVVGPISKQTLFVGGTNATVDIAGNFRDADGDTLTYTASSNNTTVADVSISGSTVTITPKTAGSVTVTVTANDGNRTATLEFQVDVLSSIIVDENLAVVVRETLGLGTNADITKTNILGLTSLRANRHNASPGPITDLTGLEHATNLTWLILDRNAISDLSPLAALTNLTLLQLRDNDISLSDISALTSLTNLTSLSLGNNEISDLSPIAALTGLSYLQLSSNEISDVTPLSNLTKLTSLSLGNNDISDVASLKNLTNLTFLNLQHNDISDITSLKNLTKLTSAYLHNNDISDVTPLKSLTGLTDFLHLYDNDISDVTPLQSLTSLKSLLLSNNQISNVSPLAALTNLDSLSLAGNAISDVSSLAALTNLSQLIISNNQIATLPADMFKGFSNLFNLRLAGNPGSPFTFTLELERTDNTDLSAASPATVKVKLAEGAPFAMTVSLSVTNGTLSVNTATIAKGSTESSAITVAQTGSEATTVSLGTTPSIPSSNYEGIQTAVGSALVLFGVAGAPFAVGTIPAQSLTVGGTAATVNVSNYFSDPDNDTLTYSASPSATSVATVSVSGSQVTVTPVAAGSATITVTANDGSLTATQTISVTVVVAGIDPPLSERTQQVRDAIVAAVPDVDSANDVTTAHLAKITSLSMGGAEITSLKTRDFNGLTSLTTLNLAVNSISDISALSGLTSLTGLYMNNNSISDISALSKLTSLKWLNLEMNSISDISALSKLTSLTSLDLDNNSIVDISAVSGLTSLTHLGLNNNSIVDISALSKLTSLTQLPLAANSISDVSPLENLTGLTALILEGNPITDYAPIRKLKKANPDMGIQLNLNNNIPVFTEGDSTTRTVAENTASGVNIGDPISATDADNHTLTYSLSGTDAESFSIVSTSGQLQTSAALDYETKTSYSVTIRVYDGNSGADFIDVTINVTDDPNAAPAAQAKPTKTVLLANFPNPFNPETWIPYQLARPADVTLTIYNVKGGVVRELVLGHRTAGVYYSRNRAAHWDGRNNIGEKVATGLYFVKFKAGDYTATRKMLIRK